MVSSVDTALSLSFSVVNHGPDFPRRIACIQIKFAVAMKQFTGLVNFYIQKTVSSEVHKEDSSYFVRETVLEV